MASESVFADSSFFFALAAKRDVAHEAAVNTFARIFKGRRNIVTTDYIVDETLTLTKSRINSTVSVALLDRIEGSGTIVLQHVGIDRFEKAKAFFRKHADHGYSFTDCTSFVVMAELRIRDALTTDRHFVEAGFRPLLPLS